MRGLGCPQKQLGWRIHRRLEGNPKLGNICKKSQLQNKKLITQTFQNALFLQFWIMNPSKFKVLASHLDSYILLPRVRVPKQSNTRGLINFYFPQITLKLGVDGWYTPCTLCAFDITKEWKTRILQKPYKLIKKLAELTSDTWLHNAVAKSTIDPVEWFRFMRTIVLAILWLLFLSSALTSAFTQNLLSQTFGGEKWVWKSICCFVHMFTGESRSCPRCQGLKFEQQIVSPHLFPS